ncbi:unnamed protein product [Prunus armeniaca]
MGIGKYREYRQNIEDIALIGDISSIHGKIWSYPPISVSTVENTDISTDISVYRPIFQSLIMNRVVPESIVSKSFKSPPLKGWEGNLLQLLNLRVPQSNLPIDIVAYANQTMNRVAQYVCVNVM